MFWFVTVLSTWLMRNNMLFNGGHKYVLDIVLLSKSIAWEWRGARFKEVFYCDNKDWFLNPLSCVP